MGSNGSEDKKEMVTTIPLYILKKILRPGSVIINSDGSFSLSLINAIAPIKIVKHSDKRYKENTRILIDEKPFDIDDFYVKYQSIETPFHSLDPLNGFIVNLGDEVVFTYKGTQRISEGKHVIEVSINTEKPIRIKFEVNFSKRII